ncbi:MAG: hypothetical protein A2381_03325 [Bdellovibrionales bacterium RIFOXYB1_FULL_37_110]|nr:MAG: hypothetical protein A2181_00430 [Bdellovibrionales bacterium RIFOXYA1_FULL_38_20]OFZ48436.1 MAG: hypothetical protein A2417_03815 [Bdellovibrionales bacterium RIFOXYC1_FULL_37_79]OFZ57957.1 MAG: hypothetical protein A2381_03325 [Bdellovibrionales bacterium RIFOXYB1_FULL_37_110]OFZ63094.1 MAG: hypothetical protein A2577_15455 [Bdellovibrionales bacterium RIFOXYD1_FULL_36_51]
MVKLLITFVAFLLAFNLFSAQVILIPNIEANCSNEDSDYNQLNRVANVLKTDNLERGEVIVEFYTDHGRCADGSYKTLLIHDNASLTFWKEGVNFPWTKYPFVSSLELLDENTAKVTLVFDIKKLFKKKAMRKFAYWFTPAPKTHYKWYIILEQRAEGDVRVVMKQI